MDTTNTNRINELLEFYFLNSNTAHYYHITETQKTQKTEFPTFRYLSLNGT